jgi:hypothetical protein
MAIHLPLKPLFSIKTSNSSRNERQVPDLQLRAKSGFEISSEAKGPKPSLKVVLTHSTGRTAKAADELCEEGPPTTPIIRSTSRSASNACAIADRSGKA